MKKVFFISGFTLLWVILFAGIHPKKANVDDTDLKPCVETVNYDIEIKQVFTPNIRVVEDVYRFSVKNKSVIATLPYSNRQTNTADSSISLENTDQNYRFKRSKDSYSAHFKISTNPETCPIKVRVDTKGDAVVI